MKLAIFGPPGAGKGTQSKTVSMKMGIPQISTGDLLRAESKSGSELGKMARSYMDRGALVPDQVVLGMLKDRLQKGDCKNGFLLDGFPRSIPQAVALEVITDLDLVVNIAVDEERLLKRITGRRMCQCGAAYHVEEKRPRVEGKCDLCGSALYQRDDDKEATVKKRMDVYRSQTAPLLEYYRQRGLVRDVDGNRSIDEVREGVMGAIDGGAPLK
ncbi:MAG: adenylate kinase [Candidatus Thermoplasmatota archaeon]|jgi:adenylate kinase|nr:adenylate kinase [Candidatus Thermoplasmatota archaeon]